MAHSKLCQLLPQAVLGLTDEDCTIAQQNHSWIYAGVAARFTAWWKENQDNLQWNVAERKFRVEPENVLNR